MKVVLGKWVLLLTVLAGPVFAAEGALKVGAARVDITPPVAELPPPYKTIHDRIYVRALILDSGAARAAVVVADVPNIQAAIFADLSQRISRQANVPLENILLGSTHTHNSIRVDSDGMGLSIAGSQKFADRVVAASLDAVKQATANLRPARAGFAAGKAHLVGDRDEWYPAQHRYIDGINRSGPVDSTLGVLKFESLSGEPIALLLNYGIEPVVGMPAASEISGDVPGAASRYIEERLADKAVAIFTIGTAESPLYRVKPESETTAAEVDRVHQIINAMGTILGEEALAAAAEIRKPVANVQIGGAKRTLQCPGKATTPFNLPNQCAYTPDSKLPACVFKDKDADPVKLSMWLLKIGDVALVQTDANVSTAVGEKLKQAAPLANTLMVALTFGPFRFVVDDASYPLNTYIATATTAKQGCAEQGFLDNALQMMEQLR
jgi:Neutral/alkaline non-lysosomal ceramidase, N-terminal